MSKLTLGQVLIYMEEIAVVTKLEWGEKEEQSMTGDIGFEVAKRIFPRKK